MIWRCDLLKQYEKYQKEIDAAIKRVLESGHYILGNEVFNFEKAFSEYLKVNHVVGVGNGTDALILAMKSFGIGEGDEVITTPFTAIPTISAIIATGARPVFTDIDEQTFLMDIEQIPSLINAKTKAIIPVHIFGNVVNIEKLREMIPEEIPIIEDAAQAHGSEINGKKAGTIGDIGIFSFYPSKNLGGYGDGGAVVTNNLDIVKKIKLLRMYGMEDKDHIVINGINSRLDELQAGILQVKLNYLDEMNQLRQRIVQRYKDNLDPNHFDLQRIPEHVYSNFHVFSVRFKGDRKELIEYLESKGIQTNVYYLMPLHLQKAHEYLGYKEGDLPKSERLCNEIIALPIYPELDLITVDNVIKEINNYIADKNYPI